MTKEISIYHEYPYFRPVPLPKDSQNNLNLNDNPVLSKYAFLVLYTLYKYRCVNKTTLGNAINLKNKNRWKEKSLKKTLQMLRKNGFIEAYGSSIEPAGVEFQTIVYILTKKGFDYLYSQYKKLDRLKIYEKNQIKASTLLKQASIAQYHISLLKNYGYMVTASKFENYITKSEEIIPSYVTFTKYRAKMELNSKQEKMAIFGIVAPRKEEELDVFLGYLLRIINEEIEDTEVFKMVMVICENNTHASWISWKINKYKQLRPFPILYLQDMITATDDPLGQVLYCETDEEGIVKSNINFFKD